MGLSHIIEHLLNRRQVLNSASSGSLTIYNLMTPGYLKRRPNVNSLVGILRSRRHRPACAYALLLDVLNE